MFRAYQQDLLNGQLAHIDLTLQMINLAGGTLVWGDFLDLGVILSRSASLDERYEAAQSIIIGAGPLPNLGPGARVLRAAENGAFRIGNFTRHATPWGRKVWQRSDINWSLKRPDGLTNLQAARDGFAPMRRIGDTWETVQLHHANQDPFGVLAEVWASTHRQHPHNVPAPSWRVTNPDAADAFRSEVPSYWRWRAGQIGGE
jgi:hypothetical protein